MKFNLECRKDASGRRKTLYIKKSTRQRKAPEHKSPK
jgi:hypothetical protein